MLNLFFAMLCCLTDARATASNHVKQQETHVELKLEQSRVAPGQPIKAMVWITNAGKRPFLVQRYLNRGPVNVEVYSTGKQKTYRHVSAMDYVSPQPVVSENCDVGSDWVAVPPGHFYGEELTLTQKVSAPGEYNVVAEFAVGDYSYQNLIEKCGFEVPPARLSNIASLTVLRK